MLKSIVLFLFLLLAMTSAEAATCSVTISQLSFGPVDSLDTRPSDTAANVSVQCDEVSGPSVTVCIHLGAGTGGSGNGLRRMTTGTATLDYQLYQDSGRSVAWGGSEAPQLGSAKRVVLGAAGLSASVDLTLYGRVPGRQSAAAAGNYASAFSGADAAYSYAEGDLSCDVPGGATGGNTSFQVQAGVPSNCLVEASDIEFGEHGIIDRNIDASGGIGITCTPGTDYSVTLGGGLRGSADPEQRILQSGSDEARYGLYQDAARSQPFGSSLDTQLPGTGQGARQSVVVYGRVPPQSLKPGTYSDTVAVTITYDGVAAP